MKTTDIRAFIPSKDYETSKAFYTELGFSGVKVTEDLTLFESEQCTFFLQRFYNKDFAENLMFQLIVLDIEQAFETAYKSKHKVKITPIQQEHWGKVFYLTGPAGELWHVTQLANNIENDI
jgi:catechol 2,3-dioxygenase-like lactoylglutathione lyase family enzyme